METYASFNLSYQICNAFLQNTIVVFSFFFLSRTYTSPRLTLPALTILLAVRSVRMFQSSELELVHWFLTLQY